MSKDQSPPAPVIDSKQDHYSDGHPLDEVQYLGRRMMVASASLSSSPTALRPQKFLDYTMRNSP